MSDGIRVLPFPRRPRRGTGAFSLEAAVEAALFAAGAPLTEGELATAIDGVAVPDVLRALGGLRRRYGEEDSGLDLVQAGGGWQIRTDPRFADVVLRVRGGQPATLSRPALEVLSIVAYEQPATRGDVEAVRGVGSAGVIKALLQRRLLRVAGRRDVPGRPLEYATTREFLELFGLDRIEDMPQLAELLPDSEDGPGA